MDGFSDRGSTPLRSTKFKECRKSENAVFMQVFALFIFLKNHTICLICVKKRKSDVILVLSELGVFC